MLIAAPSWWDSFLRTPIRRPIMGIRRFETVFLPTDTCESYAGGYDSNKLGERWIFSKRIVIPSDIRHNHCWITKFSQLVLVKFWNLWITFNNVIVLEPSRTIPPQLRLYFINSSGVTPFETRSAGFLFVLTWFQSSTTLISWITPILWATKTGSLLLVALIQWSTMAESIQ